MTPDTATIQALRSDLALQIARSLGRGGHSQVAAARHLGIPQPTVSKIMNGKVSDLSLELLIRIAVRAGLPVVLQTGSTPEEAGVFAAHPARAAPAGTPSRLADRAREDLVADARHLTAEERLAAHVRHNALVSQLHRAGQKRRRSR